MSSVSDPDFWFVFQFFLFCFDLSNFFYFLGSNLGQWLYYLDDWISLEYFCDIYDKRKKYLWTIHSDTLKFNTTLIIPALRFFILLFFTSHTMTFLRIYIRNVSVRPFQSILYYFVYVITKYDILKIGVKMILLFFGSK